MQVYTRTHVKMLDDDVARQLMVFHRHHCFQVAGCLMKNDDQGPRAVRPPIIPYAPMTRSRVYTGTIESGSFNHHSQLAKFKGKYYLGWSNGLVNEEDAGQRVMLSSSEDGKHWSEPICVAGSSIESGLAHNCVALHPTEDMLYLVEMNEETIRDATSVGMRRIAPESFQIDIHASPDGVSWKKVHSFGDQFKWIFEAPRLTSEGRLMCVSCTKKDGPAILLWPGSDICEEPERIYVPEPDGAKFPYGESSWYQEDGGRIVIYWRDEGYSCRLYVNYSDDGGRSFTSPMLSDIPDSMSRVRVGRLPDGRFYVCNNAFPTLLDRRHLMLMLSDDGETLNKAYILIDDPTSQRLKGLLKADGYQYPCCWVDGDKLLVAYSVNKEDIECGIVDLNGI